MIFEILTRRLWQHGQNKCVKRFSGGELYQAAHLVGLVLFQTAYGNRNAIGDVQLQGSFATDEATLQQEVSSHACFDSLQGVSAGKEVLPFASTRGHGPKMHKGWFPLLILMRSTRCRAFDEKPPLR